MGGCSERKIDMGRERDARGNCIGSTFDKCCFKLPSVAGEPSTPSKVMTDEAVLLND